MECGGEWRENQRTHGWWGTFVGDSRGMQNSAIDQGIDPSLYGRCDHAIGLPGKPGRNGSAGPWEIGVCVNADGTFRLQFDNYGSAGHELEALFGKNLFDLKDLYCAEVAKRQLAEDGFAISQVELEDGTIELVATR